ncbi:MAG: acyl-CoA synthetase [Bacteroidetes bacterium]|nr:MAG: acyl-CoA synthetase [Bacteroidota bacterium]
MAPDNFIKDTITEQDTFTFTLPEIIQARAIHTPDETAYVFLRDGDDDEERITYVELYQAATGIAGKLAGIGEKGERALMLFPPGLEFVKALYGCFFAGIIAVPAYTPRKNRSLERIKTLVVDSGATIVLCIADIFQSFERSFSDLEELKGLKWLQVEDCLQGDTSNWINTAPSQPADVALLQYTSGSTGKPKGVMVTHRNILRNAMFIRNSFSLSRKSVSVTWLPSFHDMGLIDGVIDPVFNGYPGVIIPPVAFIQKPLRWLKAISKYKGTHGGAPNFAFDHCVEGIPVEERAGLDLSSLSTLYCGAEPIRKSTFARFIETYRDFGFGTPMLYPCYGMAETTLIISGPPAGRGPVYLCVSADALAMNRIKKAAETDHDARFLVGVGHPWLDTEVKIVNPETLDLCNDDEVGEIWVSGSIVTAGYWNKEAETRESFAATIGGDLSVKYLRTGDLGFFDQGELYITGRLKDMIILQGRNYYPQDIEFVAEASHPALRPNASAAFSIDTDDDEKLVIVAEVERSAIRNLDVEAVCDAIRQQVAEDFEQDVYAIQLLRTASILKTSSGKIQRKACREGFLQKSLEVVGESVWASKESPTGSVVADLTSLQAWLIAWIHIHLKIPFDQIDQAKAISVYGLNSMKAVQLQQDVLTKFGVNIPPYIFFEKITVKALCEKALEKIKEVQ